VFKVFGEENRAIRRARCSAFINYIFGSCNRRLFNRLSIGCPDSCAVTLARLHSQYFGASAFSRSPLLSPIMWKLVLLVSWLVSLCQVTEAIIGHGRYDKRFLPFDLRPVDGFVGKWEAYTVSGTGAENFPFGKIVDFAIDPVTMFGARALNYTATTYAPGEGVYSNDSHILHQDYGFLPVRNKTKINPQVLLAFLTTAMEGYSIVELGLLDGNSIRLDLNKFMSRSFQLNMNGNFQVFELQREWRLNGQYLDQSVKALTSYGRSDFTVTYQRTAS